MRNINELIGIIKGINFDGIVNELEITRLQAWVDKNRNLSYDKNHTAMIKLVDEVLEDHVITEDERNRLLTYSTQYSKGSADNSASIYELNGIIEGIICDGVINSAEVIRLQGWVEENGDSIRGQKPSEEILKFVEEILVDGVITEEEKDKLLHLLSERISDTQMRTKLNHIRQLVKEHKNIGLELIDILDNEEAINYIHQKAEEQLKRAMISYSGTLFGDPEIVIISLCLIGMLEYDGSYYENVRNTYKELYRRFSEQKIEGTIRTILSSYRTVEESKNTRSRIINVALSNAIVPAHFLPAFFEFIFDIYKLNFEYDIQEDLYGEFQFIYDGLRTSMLSYGDDIQINVTKKTYKLIKTTKQLIVDGKNLDSVIKLSILIIKLIDKRIWDKEIKIFNPYLKLGFENWENTLKSNNESRRYSKTRSEFRSRWEPKIQMKNEDVYLVPPIHRVKATNNYTEITAIIKNGDNTLYFDDYPDIREIIGGYQVSVKEVKLEKPLGKLRYILMAGDELIYDSKEKLYRDFIVFDDTGNELQNNSDYKGTAIVCAESDILPCTAYLETDNYALGALNVTYGDFLLMKDKIFSFSSLAKPGIFGEELEHQFLRKEDSEELLPVFSDVKFLVFESNNNTEKYEIVINGHSYRLKEFHYTRTAKPGSWKCVVDLNLATPGVYSIAVYEIFGGNKSRIAVFRFGYDPSFSLEERKIDDYTYVVRVRTSLYEKIIEEEINIQSFTEEWLKIAYDGVNYVYFLPFHFALYRIDNNEWKPMTEGFWIGDIEQGSTLELYGTNANEFMVYSDSGKPLQEGLTIKDCKIYKRIPIGFMASYKESNDYSVLLLLQDGKSTGAIFCYNRCVLNQETTEMHFDPVTKKLYVIPYYFGKGNVVFEINNEEGDVIFRRSCLESGVQFEVDGLESFISYRFTFYEKSKGLSLQKNRELMSRNARYYARDDFAGRYFKINIVHYDQLILGKFLRKQHYFNRVYVFFAKRLSNDIFEGDIFIKTAKGKFGLLNINPVEIEICSAVINDEIELSITKDGDGLFLDFEHHGIMNTLDDDKAIDIFSYTIDAKGEATL